MALWDLINRTERGVQFGNLSHPEASIAGWERSVSPRPSVCLFLCLFSRLLSVWFGPAPDEGDFPGKVIWKYGKKKNKKNPQSLNSKSMFHSISNSISLCVCVCILWVERPSSTLKALCFSSVIKKSRLSGVRASCTLRGEAREEGEAGGGRERQSQVDGASGSQL